MEEKFIPLSVPNIKGNEIKYVTSALEAEWVSTGGEMINRFERDIAEYVRADGAAACQSGTAGIHLALHYLGVEAGDAVIVPALTFIAAVNPVRYEGAEPIFMDCDDSLCMDPVKLGEFLENECEQRADGALYHKDSGRRIRALIVVHIFGNMADMDKIISLAESYGLPVVEDATEALGTRYTEGRYKGRFAGTIGDIGIYSFNGNKIITTGGGGMVVARDKRALDKIKYLSTQAKDDAANFVHNEVGYNYRMTNVQAAIGVAQLERLEEFIGIKRRNYLHYKAGTERISGARLLGFREDIRPNYWFYSLYLEDGAADKQTVIDGLAQRKIQSRPIWGLINEQKPYAGSICYRLEVCAKYYERVVNIPCSTNLSEADADRVLDAVRAILS
ncbi:MAG: LegC family aminotransferase [Butyrivibrio sp.]|nr:LegC family aminotransferase [Butyrivibrio sp.]